MTIHIDREIPIVIRKYEKKWNIPSNAARWSLTYAGKSNYMIDDIAEKLSLIATAKDLWVIEASELFTRKTQLCEILSTSIETIQQSDSREKLMQEWQNVVVNQGGIVTNDYFYSFALNNDLNALKKYIWILSKSVEVYFTLWRNSELPIPVLIESIFGRSKNRLERDYLENIDRCVLIAFLSEGHKNIEIISSKTEMHSRIDSVLGKRSET